MWKSQWSIKARVFHVALCRRLYVWRKSNRFSEKKIPKLQHAWKDTTKATRQKWSIQIISTYIHTYKNLTRQMWKLERNREWKFKRDMYLQKPINRQILAPDATGIIRIHTVNTSIFQNSANQTARQQYIVCRRMGVCGDRTLVNTGPRDSGRLNLHWNKFAHIDIHRELHWYERWEMSDEIWELRDERWSQTASEANNPPSSKNAPPLLSIRFGEGRGFVGGGEGRRGRGRGRSLRGRRFTCRQVSVGVVGSESEIESQPVVDNRRSATRELNTRRARRVTLFRCGLRRGRLPSPSLVSPPIADRFRTCTTLAEHSNGGRFNFRTLSFPFLTYDDLICTVGPPSSLFLFKGKSQECHLKIIKRTTISPFSAQYWPYIIQFLRTNLRIISTHNKSEKSNDSVWKFSSGMIYEHWPVRLCKAIAKNNQNNFVL